MKHRAAEKIQKAWKNYQVIMNKEDIFTCEDLRPGDPIFPVWDGKNIYQFHTEHLVQYICSAGNFQNPYNRVPFSDATLHRLTESFHTLEPKETKDPPIFAENRRFVRGVNLAIIRPFLTRWTEEKRIRSDLADFLSGRLHQTVEQTVRMFSNLPPDLFGLTVGVISHAQLFAEFMDLSVTDEKTAQAEGARIQDLLVDAAISLLSYSVPICTLFIQLYIQFSQAFGLFHTGSKITDVICLIRFLAADLRSTTTTSVYNWMLTAS